MNRYKSKKIVISLGGSLISDNFNYEHIIKYVNIFEKLYIKGYNLIVTVGGGKTARKYIDILSRKKFSSLKEKNVKSDIIAVAVTHCNALLLKSLTDEKIVYPKIPKSNFAIKSAIKQQQKSGCIIYCGGTHPNQSTDGVASFCAISSDAKLIINATNIDGVYSKNPKEHKDAKKIDKLSFDEFKKIISLNAQEPGKYALFDLSAISYLNKKNINLIILDGRYPENILRALEGDNSGTLIK